MSSYRQSHRSIEHSHRCSSQQRREPYSSSRTSRLCTDSITDTSPKQSPRLHSQAYTRAVQPLACAAITESPIKVESESPFIIEDLVPSIHITTTTQSSSFPRSQSKSSSTVSQSDLARHLLLSQSLAPPVEVPLRATQACRAMRRLMSLFRLNPFAMQHGGRNRSKQRAADLTWCGELPHPLDKPPRMFQWQLNGYDNHVVSHVFLPDDAGDDEDDEEEDSFVECELGRLRAFSVDFEIEGSDGEAELAYPSEASSPIQPSPELAQHHEPEMSLVGSIPEADRFPEPTHDTCASTKKFGSSFETSALPLTAVGCKSNKSTAMIAQSSFTDLASPSMTYLPSNSSSPSSSSTTLVDNYSRPHSADSWMSGNALSQQSNLMSSDRVVAPRPSHPSSHYNPSLPSVPNTSTKRSRSPSFAGGSSKRPRIDACPNPLYTTSSTPIENPAKPKLYRNRNISKRCLTTTSPLSLAPAVPSVASLPEPAETWYERCVSNLQQNTTTAGNVSPSTTPTTPQANFVTTPDLNSGGYHINSITYIPPASSVSYEEPPAEYYSPRHAVDAPFGYCYYPAPSSPAQSMSNPYGGGFRQVTSMMNNTLAFPGTSSGIPGAFPTPASVLQASSYAPPTLSGSQVYCT